MTKTISKAQIEYVVDINRDKRPDKIQCEAWGEESEGKDEHGKTIYISAEFFECVPFVRDARKDSVFFSWALNTRKSASELVFDYDRNYTPFLDRTGFKTFWAGQKILFGGKTAKISSFQVILNPYDSKGQPTVTNPVAVLADGRIASLDDFTLTTSKGERLDPHISVRLALTHDKKSYAAIFSEATTSERYFVGFLRSLKKMDIKKGTKLETISKKLIDFMARNPALKDVCEGEEGKILFNSLTQCALRFLEVSK